jgi:long-chain acyl-CoA synthetase
VLLHEALLSTARRLPTRTAVVDRHRRLTYAALAGEVRRFAAALRARGVRPGDRVAVFLPNIAEAVVAMYGALRAGAVFVPVAPLRRPERLAALLADAGAVALVSSTSLADVWGAALGGGGTLRFVVAVAGAANAAGAASNDALPVPVVGWGTMVGEGEDEDEDGKGVGDGDLAALIYTSGSTGEPKGVMLTHLNMVTVATTVSRYLGLDETDVLYCALPLSFSYGICQLTAAFPVGASVVLDLSFAFPAKSLAFMAAEGATCFAGVPTMYAVLVGLPDLGRHQLGSLRLLTNAADALPEPMVAAVRRLFPGARLYSMYGLTECQRVSYLPPEELDRRPGSVGRGMANQELWLVDEGGRRLGPGAGVTGELVVSGDHVMRGYWQRPEETAARLRPGPVPGRAVLHTGDVFRTDAEGFLYFVGRTDDLIKSRGEKVSPREVESAIHALAGIAAVAAVGVVDPVLGHAIKVFVVRADGASLTERDVLRHCKESLEPHMVPHQIVFVDTLPVTASGKVRRADLRGPAA